MSVRKKHSSPNGKIPLWAKRMIRTATGTKKAAIRPSPGRRKRKPPFPGSLSFSGSSLNSSGACTSSLSSASALWTASTFSSLAAAVCSFAFPRLPAFFFSFFISICTGSLSCDLSCKFFCDFSCELSCKFSCKDAASSLLSAFFTVTGLWTISKTASSSFSTCSISSRLTAFTFPTAVPISF